MSAEASQILNQFYAGVVRTMGSPRVMDTLYRTAKMIARLKLKRIVEACDAREACEFYNVIQNEYNRVVYIPPDPKETAITECLYTLEASQTPMLVDDVMHQTCNRNDYVCTYIGPDHRHWTNKKVRKVVESLLENSHVERVQINPIVLRFIRHNKPDLPDLPDPPVSGSIPNRNALYEIVLSQKIQSNIENARSDMAGVAVEAGNNAKKPYSNYLVDGVPIWQLENRRMTEEEAEAYKEEVSNLGKRSKLEGVVETNLSGNGLLGNKSREEA